jgi:hypothetical protein
MVRSGGKINFVYDKLFKGAAISKMSDFSILKVLEKDIVVRASRVSFLGMYVEICLFVVGYHLCICCFDYQ